MRDAHGGELTDAEKSDDDREDKKVYVVIDSRGGISVDLKRMLATEHGQQSIEKLRRVPVEADQESNANGEANNSQQN